VASAPRVSPSLDAFGEVGDGADEWVAVAGCARRKMDASMTTPLGFSKSAGDVRTFDQVW